MEYIPIKWPRSTKWNNATVCLLVGLKPSSITDIERKFFTKLYYAMRKDKRTQGERNSELLGQIMSYFEVTPELMKTIVKKEKIPL